MKGDGSSDGKVVRLIHRGTTTPRRDPAIDRVEQTLREALCTLDDDLLDTEDQAAIASETRFLQRFGFDACRARRRLVLEFKHVADVTDREIKHLHRVGCLCFRGQGIRISASAFVAAYGWCLISYFAVLMGLAFGRMVMGSHPSALVMGLLAVFELVMIVGMGLAHRVYIQPRRILCRIRMKVKA
ncbi:MAG: hypothetical protein JSS07_12730 [Proteobacteria bacterium]|nr:hypothetical protein [Pseudomonadota bacterium]